MLVVWSDEYYGPSHNPSRAMGFRSKRSESQCQKKSAGEAMPARGPSSRSSQKCSVSIPITRNALQESNQGSNSVQSAVKEWKCAMAAWRKCGTEGTGRHSLTVRLSTLNVGLDAVRELKVRRRGEVKSNRNSCVHDPHCPHRFPTFIQGR